MKFRLKTSRRIHGSYDPSTKDTSPFCFYKLMVSPMSPNIQFKKLMLPETFTSAFGDELSETCRLTVPTGETHQVGLVEEDNELWFQDGWELFVDRFSIGYGYFMLFIYNGNSNFKVNIFDLTACEISYPCDKGTSSAVQNEPYLGDLSPKFSEELDCKDNQNIVLQNLHSPSTSPKRSDDEMKAVELRVTIADMLEENEGSQSGRELPTWLRSFKKEMKDMIAAGIGIPKNPFFVALMKPYRLNIDGYLNIPKAFAQKHMKCKVGDFIKIQMCDGRQWEVRCFRSNSTHCSLGKGWVQFTEEACLVVGDVCLFELIDAENCVLKVYVAKSS